jgi:hypothetical protein
MPSARGKPASPWQEQLRLGDFRFHSWDGLNHTLALELEAREDMELSSVFR